MMRKVVKRVKPVEQVKGFRTQSPLCVCVSYQTQTPLLWVPSVQKGRVRVRH